MEPTETEVEFERHRRHLLGVAYRILGTWADAEDAVQESCLRFANARMDEVRDVRAWLTTAVSRSCLDPLRSARARRERYIGPWLPEPVVDTASSLTPAPIGPEDRVTLDESVTMAGVAFGSRDRLLLPRQSRNLAELPLDAHVGALPGMGHVPAAVDAPAVVALITSGTSRAGQQAPEGVLPATIRMG